MKKIRMSDIHRRRFLAPALVSLFALYGCLGDGSESAATGTPAPAPAPVASVDTACQQPTDTGSVVVGSGDAGDPAAPEPASGYRTGKTVTYAKTYMVVTANPLATQAGCEILKRGGTAVDAAVAVQAVLGLVEPQSSGLGGGAFMLHYNATTKAVQAYDGRETAPAAATEDYLRYISPSQTTLPVPSARRSGRSIGTPGAVRMLELAYQDHGKLAWGGLFDGAIKLARDGHKIGGRMADAISSNRTSLLLDADATAYFLNADYSAKTLGTLIKNPAYADTLDAIAKGGANAFYTGPIAQSIVDKIKITSGGATTTSAITPGLTELSDLAGYQAKRRTPVCTTYRAYWVCGMSPPSSGGIAVAQSLGILENFYMAGHAPTALDLEGGKPTVMGVHLVSEANRLAYADRDKYVADTDFVPLPGGGIDAMVDKTYLRGRANLIRFDSSMGTAVAGTFTNIVPAGIDTTEEHGTTHFTIVDKYGNVVVMTTTVESSMGSFHMTRGFVLNNQLTDFSSAPSDTSGPIANRVGPLKRPRSSMAPTLVFAKASDGSRGDFLMGTGSPGGATIIQYVVKTLVGALDWGLNAQQATSLVDFGASNSATTTLGGEHPNINTSNNGNNDPLITGLRQMGHTVSTSAQSSGIATIIKTQVNAAPVLSGGADPRREGIVLGDTFKP